MIRTSRARKGFSLLELLVVISIIAILVAIAAVSYTTVQKKGRDARRESDIKNIAVTLEQFYATNNSVYPTGGNCQNGGGYAYFQGGSLPADPKTGTIYDVTCTSATNTFCACARLDNDGTGNSDTNACTYSGAGTKNYYCLSNQQ